MKWREVVKIAEEVDKRGFIREYLLWGDRLEKSFNNATELDEKHRNIVVIGMGGSGIVGDILRDYINLRRKNISVYVYKGIKPPKKVVKKSLVIGVSHSGNTIETINTLLDIRDDAKRIAVVTTGGRLEKLADKYSWIKILVEPALAPRAGLPQLLGATLKLINKCLRIEHKISRVSKKLKRLGDRLSLKKKENEAYMYAKDIWGRIPAIYSYERYIGILHRIKSSFNENSKINAYYSTFPEGYHNEVEAYEDISNTVIPLILRDKDEEIDYLIHYLRNIGMDYILYSMKEKDPLERIFTTIMFFDIVSIYLAYLRRMDPYEIKAINIIKGLRS